MKKKEGVTINFIMDIKDQNQPEKRDWDKKN